MKSIINLRDENQFEIRNYLSSANMARLSVDHNLKGFQNRGYFQLFAINEENKKILIDRHSRKRDLENILDLFSQY